MNSYPRETTQFQPVIVTENGLTITTGVKFSDVPDGSRPTTWVTPTTLNGAIGVMVAGYPAGRRRIFAQVTANPETPVIDCGVYMVT